MVGVEYVVLQQLPPSFYVIAKRMRTSPDEGEWLY